MTPSFIEAVLGRDEMKFLVKIFSKGQFKSVQCGGGRQLNVSEREIKDGYGYVEKIRDKN